MAVKLRLMRMGKKKQPTYRVVAADSRSPRDGRFIEAVGVYAPRGTSSTDRDAVVRIDDAKALSWLARGAKPTDRVERLLEQTGTLERFRTGAGPAAAPSEPGPGRAASDAEPPASGAPAAVGAAVAESGSGAQSEAASSAASLPAEPDGTTEAQEP